MYFLFYMVSMESGLEDRNNAIVGREIWRTYIPSQWSPA